MLRSFIVRPVSVLRPAMYLGSGGAWRTRSGALRWTCRPTWNSERDQRQNAFRQILMARGPWLRFASYARDLRNLPECAPYENRQWRGELSTAARIYLERLDALQSVEPLLAIRIAAITAATVTPYVLHKKIVERVGRWLLDGKNDRIGHIKLGLKIQKNWPAMSAQERITDWDNPLLTLMVDESASNSAAVYQLIEPFLPEEGLPPYLFSHRDDPTLLLNLGRSLEVYAPAFALKVRVGFLFEARCKFSRLNASEGQKRDVADEIFERLSAASSVVPSQDLVGNYLTLAKWGYPDKAWFPAVLNWLFEYAAYTHDKLDAADKFCSLAMNAPAGSELAVKAQDRFFAWASSYTGWKTESKSTIENHVNRLLNAVKIATKEPGLQGLNVDIPTQPDHQVVQIANEAYWGLVGYLEANRSAFCLVALASGVARGEFALAQDAARRMESVFPQLANCDLDVAVSSLVKIGQRTLNSDVTAEGKEWFRNVFYTLHPMLLDIDAAAAEKAKEEAFFRSGYGN